MFGLFTSPDKQMLDNARNWLDAAKRVYNYRRDQMSEITLVDLQRKTEKLRALVREKADAARLKLAIEELEPMLAKVGGRIYPHSTLREWVEFFVVAAIFLIGSRQFFFQPFKIPTNSMWPTYNGMTPEVHATPADEPGAAVKIFRTLAYGASAYRIDAETSGEVLIAIDGRGLLRSPSRGRQWLVFPQAQYKYELFVGNEQTLPDGSRRYAIQSLAGVSVPRDFDMRWLLRDAFAPGASDLSEAIRGWTHIDRAMRDEQGNTVGIRFYRTGKYVKAGERVLSFDIITGDQLFVDRMSYHFVKPRIGSGFVFRTTNIPGTVDESGNHIDSYYIKRLAGVPGDTLEIRDGVLYRNGTPITGAQAFADNNARAGQYRGYDTGPVSGHPDAMLRPGQKYTVTENGYVALGDNSYNSADSRYWGEVPKKDAVGRPLFVFYPFSKHWGPAK